MTEIEMLKIFIKDNLQKQFKQWQLDWAKVLTRDRQYHSKEEIEATLKWTDVKLKPLPKFTPTALTLQDMQQVWRSLRYSDDIYINEFENLKRQYLWHTNQAPNK